MKEQTIERVTHTPGPWIWDKYNHDNRMRSYIRSNHRLFEKAQSGGAVCKVCSNTFGYEQTMANAQLIATAPELLEFVKSYQAFRGGAMDGTQLDELAGALLAKATETP